MIRGSAASSRSWSKKAEWAVCLANARPFSLDVLSSDVPVIAVLEIRGGEAKQLGLGVGDRVSWER